MRSKLIFQIYALAVCFAAVLGLTFKVAEIGFGITKTYIFERALGTSHAEMIESDEVFLDRAWRKEWPLPDKVKLESLKKDFLKAWELEDKRRGKADIIQAAFEAAALSVLFALHWFLARRLQKAIET